MNKLHLLSGRFLGQASVLLLIGLLMFACEKQEIIFEGPYHVRFTRLDTAIRESVAGTIRVPIHNAGPQLSTPISVNYVIDGNAREGIDYRIVGERGAVIIPANQSFGYIELQLINNANNILESQDIIFTITRVNPDDLRIGFGAGQIGSSTRFTIIDECLFSGTYSGVNLNESPMQLYTGIGISSTDCREYVLSNWNLGVFSIRAVRANLTFIDNGDNSLTIPPQINPELAAPRDTISGDGFINPLDQTLTFNVQVKVPVNAQRDTTITLNFRYTPVTN
jgi:hypothetical protein